jgi:hypothetical protein
MRTCVYSFFNLSEYDLLLSSVSFRIMGSSALLLCQCHSLRRHMVYHDHLCGVIYIPNSTFAFTFFLCISGDCYIPVRTERNFWKDMFIVFLLNRVKFRKVTCKCSTVSVFCFCFRCQGSKKKKNREFHIMDFGALWAIHWLDSEKIS